MISVQNLTKTIRGTTVLSDVSLEARPGRITGFAGPNGSGKTMLMRAIVGLVRPTSGSVSVDGVDPWGASCGRDGSAMPAIGLLLEGPAFLDGYTGLRNLELLASIRGLASHDDVCAAIRSMGLDPDDRRTYRKYSLGMKQRLGLAAAFMETPPVLILDEPTNALDTAGVELAVGAIRAARDRGATVILACHDADVLRDLSDEIWYLAEGHLDGHEVLDARSEGDALEGRHEEA
jgi:ABC-2 type transport system ATP-binding protein